jgi:hypothetical protein
MSRRSRRNSPRSSNDENSPQSQLSSAVMMVAVAAEGSSRSHLVAFVYVSVVSRAAFIGYLPIPTGLAWRRL